MAMDGGSGAAMIAAGEAASQMGPRAGIFLHAGWRSCGTWMWERLRENVHVHAFYEPLHEDLATLRAREIGLLRPDAWQSGHGTSAPYFAEYAPLLGLRGGVHGHAARFAFDNYFCPASQDDAELERYVRGLVSVAAETGRLPVLKFCRSLGRVPWLEARFPDMLHVVVLRDPRAQWLSARHQMEQNGNRYFVVAPFVILARNPENRLLAEAAERLGVRLPPSLGNSLKKNLSITTDTCWRHVSGLSWQDRFRGFLALWIASEITALQGTAIVIDADELSTNVPARCVAETALAQASGLPIDLTPGKVHGRDMPMGYEGELTDAAAAAAEAIGFLDDHAAGLAQERMAVLAAKMKRFAASGHGNRTHCAHRPGPWAYVDAAAYVALMRASYPLRRAHFHLRRWLDADGSPKVRADKQDGKATWAVPPPPDAP